ALTDRGVDRVDDVLAALPAHRPALPGRVGAVRDDLRAVDAAAHRLHAGGVARMQRNDRARIEQCGEPDLRFPRVELAGTERCGGISGGGGFGRGNRHKRHQAFVKTRATLWPPKPNESLTAAVSS